MNFLILLTFFFGFFEFDIAIAADKFLKRPPKNCLNLVVRSTDTYKIKPILTRRAQNHIFYGEFQERRLVSGLHSWAGYLDFKRQLIASGISDREILELVRFHELENGIVVVNLSPELFANRKVKGKLMGVAKSGKGFYLSKTLFPLNWTLSMIANAIRQVATHPEEVSRMGNQYRLNGKYLQIPIEVLMEEDGKILTAYPSLSFMNISRLHHQSVNFDLNGFVFLIEASVQDGQNLKKLKRKLTRNFIALEGRVANKAHLCENCLDSDLLLEKILIDMPESDTLQITQFLEKEGYPTSPDFIKFVVVWLIDKPLQMSLVRSIVKHFLNQSYKFTTPEQSYGWGNYYRHQARFGERYSFYEDYFPIFIEYFLNTELGIEDEDSSWDDADIDEQIALRDEMESKSLIGWGGEDYYHMYTRPRYDDSEMSIDSWGEQLRNSDQPNLPIDVLLKMRLEKE